MEDEIKIKNLESEIKQYILTMPSVIRNLSVTPNLINLITQKVDLLLVKTFNVGNEIINDVINLCENDISYLAELEHCYKSKKRIVEKVYSFMCQGMDVDTAMDKIEDTLRFTYIIIDEENYLIKVQEYLNELEARGCYVYEFLNFWGNEFYQGINVLLERDGIKFEIQFHTPNSFEIKEGYTREPYIVARNSLSDPQMLEKANILRKYYQKKVNVPNGSVGFQYKK